MRTYRYEYAVTPERVRNEISEAAAALDSPRELLRWSFAFQRDVLYGGLTGDEFWLFKKTFMTARMPLRYFQGRIFRENGMTVAEGHFRFAGGVLAGHIAAWVFLMVVIAALAVSGGMSAYGVLWLLAVFQICGAIFCGVSYLIHAASRRYILDFLEGLGE